jgi:hypothetical protein
MNTSLGLLQSVGIGLAAIVLLAVVAVILLILRSAIRIVKEYERGVIFRLGRVQGRAKGPGLFILVPIADRMVKVGLRTVTLDVPPQDLITRPARVQREAEIRTMRCCTVAAQQPRAVLASIPCSSSFTCKTQQILSGPDETRTRDLRHARAALSRLSYGPVRPEQS